MINEQQLMLELNTQTAKIAWNELLRFFASGKTLWVKPHMDLIQVAAEVIQDNQPQIQQWMEQQDIQEVSDQQAKQWLDKEVWAVVCKPWVLVKPLS